MLPNKIENSCAKISGSLKIYTNLYKCKILVVLPNSKVRKNAKAPICTYKILQGSLDSKITPSLEEVLENLNVSIKIKQTPEIEKILLVYENENVNDEYANKLIEGLTDIEIHNDAGCRRIEEEVTLFTLFQAINSLSSNLIDKAYSHVLDNCVLTDNALTNFDKARKRYSKLSTSLHVLEKIIRCHNNEYYKTVLSHIIDQNEIEIKDIDLRDSFTFNDIRKKAELYK